MSFRLITLLFLFFSISSYAENTFQIQEQEVPVQETVVNDTVVQETIVKDTIIKATLINGTVVKDTLIVADTIAGVKKVANAVVRDTIVNDTIIKATLINGAIVKDTLIVTDTLMIGIVGAKKVRDTIIKETAVIRAVPQDTTVVKNERISYWNKVNKVGLDLNEVAFVNWSSGGNNSFSALTHAMFERTYEVELLKWENRLNIKYGFNAQEGRELRKTEDNIEIISNFGYRRDSISNWFYSAKLDFSTQFAKGYKYPNTEEAISKLMAPGYLFVGVGTEYSSPTQDFTVYISPVTDKSTFVLDQRLADEGAFGVTPAVRDEEGNIIQEGQKVRTQFGFLLSSDFSAELWENVGVNNRVRLYSDYLNKFGNIDVDWELNLRLKVNEYIMANVGSHLKYDDDIKVKEDVDGDGELETGGPKVQFKQMLGIGVVYQF